MTGIALIRPTSKVWPKSPSVRAMPLNDRRMLADYIRLIHPGCPAGTDEGLFGVANILFRAGLDFGDLADLIFDETAEGTRH